MLNSRMKSIAVCLALAGLLVACGDDRQAESATASSGTPQDTATPGARPDAAMPAPRPGPVPAPDDRKGEDLLAKSGVEFDFPHAVMYDILDTSNAGTPRHRVLVEVLHGDFATAVKALDGSLTGLGYEKTRDTNKGGRIEQIFEQAGRPAYYLLMQPAGMGPKLSGPDSTGSIHIMWNITNGS